MYTMSFLFEFPNEKIKSEQKHIKSEQMRITSEKVSIYSGNWKSEAPSIEFWENVSTPRIKTEQTDVYSEASNTKSEHMGETLSKIKLRREDFRIL